MTARKRTRKISPPDIEASIVNLVRWLKSSMGRPQDGQRQAAAANAVYELMLYGRSSLQRGIRLRVCAERLAKGTEELTDLQRLLESAARKTGTAGNDDSQLEAICSATVKTTGVLSALTDLAPTFEQLRDQFHEQGLANQPADLGKRNESALLRRVTRMLGVGGFRPAHIRKLIVDGGKPENALKRVYERLGRDTSSS